MTAAQSIRLANRLRVLTCWLVALGLALLVLAKSTAGDYIADLLGPDDIATEQLIASDMAADDRASAEQAEAQAAQWRYQVRQAVRLACGKLEGRLNRNGDIQCLGADGSPAFFAYRWQQ